MSRTGLWRILLGVTVAALVITWFVQHVEWVNEKVPGHMRGEALRDPFYAARLLIARLGYRTATISDPSQLALQPGSSTIVAINLFAGAVAHHIEPQLVNWIKRGGHLVVVVPGPGQSDNFTTRLGLHRLGIHRQKTPLHLSLEGRTLDANMPMCDVFRVDEPLIWSATVNGYTPYPDEKSDDKPVAVKADAMALARWHLGAGTVTAMCNDTPLYNQSIGQNQHAELAARLLLDGRDGTVIFTPHPLFPKLYEWLFTNVWSALAGAAVLLILILWHAMPRFGPIAPDALPARPGLRDHLRAMAEFHLRKRHYLQLLAAPRETVRLLLERHAGSGGNTLREIAQLSGTSIDDLHQALQAEPNDRITYLRLAAILARVSDQLQPYRPKSSTPRTENS